MIDHKLSNNKGFRYIFVIVDNFSNILRCILLKKWSNNYKQIFKYFNNIIIEPLKIESDRGTDFYNSKSQSFLKTKIYDIIQDSQIKVHQKLIVLLDLYVIC